jgi:type VI protein secretion system component VasK
MSMPPPNLPPAPHLPPPPNMPAPPPPPTPSGILAKLTSRKVWIPIACVLAFVLVVLLAWWLSGSWLAALVAALAISLVVLVVVLLRVVFTQDRDDRIERGIHDPQRAAHQQQLQAQQAQASDLDGAFRRGIADLQASKLGGDVYALPWMLVVGATGAGKTDCLLSSGLDVPPEFAHLRPTGPTRDCGFWFTNQAILVDTAGRFVESEDTSVAEEWRRLLQLLRSTRPGVPLDGLVFAVSIDELLGRSPQELADRAHTLRRRINELTDQLRLDVPVYVLVTKSDHLEGFSEFAQALPPDRHREAFGWTNDRRYFADAGELLGHAFAEVVDQLEYLLPEILLREADPVRRRRIFLFPQEFQEACQSVASFLRAAFAPSVYGEVPFLRGVYFVSAKREGTTVSPFLQRLGHDWARTQLDAGGGQQPLFLMDVFREVALGDRDLAIPANWMGRRFRRAMVFATAAIALLAMLLLGVSFVDNLITIRGITNESRLVVDGASNLASLERLRTAVLETGPPGDSIQRLPLHGVGLGGNLDRATERARRTFSWAFGHEFETPTKNRLMGKVRERESDSFEALATLALDVSWLATRAPEEGAVRPNLAPFAPIGRNEADLAAFTAGYDSFTRWIEEPALRTRVEGERDAVNAAAPSLLDLRRLEQWAAATREPIRYADFGIAAPESARVDEVHPAYTKDVWNSLVRDLVAGVEGTGSVSSGQVDKFRRSYAQNFDRNWRDFLLGTPTTAVSRGRRKDSPYLALVERVDAETRTELRRDGAEPSWISLLREVRRTTPASEEEPLAPWQRYEVELDQVDVDVEAATEQGEQALEMTRRLRDPEGTSFSSALSLVREIVRSDRDAQATRKLREILSMPFYDGAADVMASALGELDQRWRDNLVNPFSGALDSRELAALYRPDSGELDKFSRDNELSSFYADGRALPVLGDASLAFGSGFLGWMQHAEEMQRALYPGPGEVPRISVRLEGIPSRVVSGSGLFVTRRELSLACDADDDTFIYREGSGSHTFNWSPHCQELSLRIWVRQDGSERELMPRKEWQGPLAFPQWLQRAQSVSGNVKRWRLDYDGVELLVDYRLRSGGGIVEIAHRPPPGSMRN